MGGMSYTALCVGGPLAGQVHVSEGRIFQALAHEERVDVRFDESRPPASVEMVDYWVQEFCPPDADPDRRSVWIALAPDVRDLAYRSQGVPLTLFAQARSLGCVKELGDE